MPRSGHSTGSSSGYGSGLNGNTACVLTHRVLIVLVSSLSLGQSGRYTLREKFKDFERCMTPSERLLETLKKYGEQAKEVQLTLIHNGSSLWDDMSRTKGRYQAGPPLRRKDAEARMLRGSSSLGLHRQSLPPLSCSRQEAEQQKEELKRPKRKSLTLMSEAWEWLESLGKGRVYSTASDKESSKRTDRRNLSTVDVSLSGDKGNSGRSSRSRVRGKEKPMKLASDQQSSCCRGSETRSRESKQVKSEDCATTEDEKNNLRETITRRLGCLQDLQVQIALIDKQIFELEEKQRAKRSEQEAQQRKCDEEMDQIKFWENELKAEEGYEKDLQRDFLEMRQKAADCKVKLENYKRKIQGLDLFGGQNSAGENSVSNAADVISTVSTGDQNQQQSDGKSNRKFLPKDRPPHALVTPSQTKERRPTGPTELREWWKRWSEAQSAQAQNTKVIHRSELTIYLGGTKV